MNQDSIKMIKRRAKSVEAAVKFIFFAMIVFSVAAIVFAIFLSFAPQERFYAVRGNLDWSVNYRWTNNSSSGVFIPFKIIQPLDSSMFSAKAAFLTYLISCSIFKFPVIILGIKQVAGILDSTINDITPFVMDNVKRFKKLAYLMIFYSAAADILLNLLCCIFVTKIFLIDLFNVHITGVLVGGLILIIADIFKYGVFLQSEFDTTL